MKNDVSYEPAPNGASGKSGPSLRTSILIVAVLLAAALLFRFALSRIGGRGSSPWEQAFSESVRQAEIQGISCDVILLPAEDGLCRVEYTGSRSCTCTAEVRNGSLTVTEKPRRFRFLSFLPGPDTKLTVYLPSDMESISMTTASGDYEMMEGISAEEMDLESVSGDITAADLQCDTLRLETVSGDVELSDTTVCGTAKLQSVSGEISLVGFDGAGLSVETISGDVSAHDADAEELEVSTTSGEVFLVLTTPKEYVISTVSGDVNVPASDPGGGTCRIDTISGDISIQDGSRS